MLTARHSGQETEAYLCTLRPSYGLHSSLSYLFDSAVDSENVSARQASLVYPAGCSYSVQQHQQGVAPGSDGWDCNKKKHAMNRYLEMEERHSTEPDRKPRAFDVCKQLARCGMQSELSKKAPYF